MDGKDIAQKRKELGVSQSALAQRLSDSRPPERRITKAALSAVENGAVNLLPDELVDIWNTLIAMRPDAILTENAA